MRVILVQPQTPPVVHEITGDLASLQACVAGYVEQIARDGHVAILANEEGRLRSMAWNRAVVLSGGRLVEIVGPFLLVGSNPQQGVFEDLSDADIATWFPRLA